MNVRRICKVVVVAILIIVTPFILYEMAYLILPGGMIADE